MTSRLPLRPTRLGAYMSAVAALGLALGVLAGWLTPWPALGHRWLVLAALVAVLIFGELRPIPVVRGDEAGDEISISTTLALALVLLAPPGVAVAAQACALLADEAVERRDWGRLFFNVGQYTVALVGAAATYTALSGVPLSEAHRPLAASDLAPSLVASVVFFLLNNVLTDVAVAMKLRRPVLRHVLDDLRCHSVVSGVLLGLAPLFAEAVSWTPWSLPLLLMPLVAVHQSARLAAARQHDALHDALTGLPNRALFTSRLREACERLDAQPFGVMLLDLDHFKEINDTLGHHVGDLLLSDVARRLVEHAPSGATVARLGGDEFAILVPGLSCPQESAALGGRLARELAQPFVITGVRLDVAGSAGVALAPRDGRAAEDLLRRADVALYRAKEQRGRQVQYDAARDQHSVERLQLLGELRDGLDAGALQPRYQPIVHCGTGQPLGVEALARWEHPDRGLLNPDQFIALAENTGLIDRLTLALLDEALEQLGKWHARGHVLGLSVNLSPRSLNQPGFPATIADVLQLRGVDPSWLTLEVTESVIVQEFARSVDTLAGLREQGISIAIDDFGTGYSSLAYLKRLPVDIVKIDRSFVTGMAEDRHDDAIVRATIDLAHEFGLRVVAEGVESAAVLDRLAWLGCDAAQGYHIDRPMPGHAVAPWLVRHGRHVPLSHGRRVS